MIEAGFALDIVDDEYIDKSSSELSSSNGGAVAGLAGISGSILCRGLTGTMTMSEKRVIAVLTNGHKPSLVDYP